MKLTSIDELTDEIVGKPGKKERDIFEYELRMDIVGTMIREVSTPSTKFMYDYFVILCDISSLLIGRRATAILLLRASIYLKVFRNNSIQT